MFEFIATHIAGCFEVQPKVLSDDRGRFVKGFHTGAFKENGLVQTFDEVYYSVSRKGVLRGLHFQSPPDAHVKLVSCVRGRILDVVVDLRKDSTTYHRVHSTELSATKGNMLYVPEGLAHGFLSLEDDTLFLSMNSKEYSPQCDSGIRWDSIGFVWPIENLIVSEKDQNMIPLSIYNSPF